jgi:hypothetical protein
MHDRYSTRRPRYVYCAAALKRVTLNRIAVQSGSRAHNSGKCSAARREILVSLSSAVTEGWSPRNVDIQPCNRGQEDPLS